MSNIEIAMSKDSDGDFTIILSGASEVSESELKKELEQVVARLRKGPAPQALGVEILQWWQHGWNSDYYHEPGGTPIEDDEGNVILEPDQTYELDELGDCVPNREGEGLEVIPVLEAFQAWKKSTDPRRTSSRYPYTFAYDFLRMRGPRMEGQAISPKFSRSDCAQFMQALEEGTGLGAVRLSERLADYYLENEDEVVGASIERANKGW